MKKITCTLLLLFSVVSMTMQAQEAEGTKTVQNHSNHTVKQVNFGIIGASLEFPVHKNISIAPAAGTDFELNWLSLGAKGNFYFDNLFELPSAWDVYAGANAGFAVALGNNSKSDDFILVILLCLPVTFSAVSITLSHALMPLLVAPMVSSSVLTPVLMIELNDSNIVLFAIAVMITPSCTIYVN